MANWDKLNRKFDNIIETLQDSDWLKWKCCRTVKKEMRRLKLIQKTKIYKEKIKD